MIRKLGLRARALGAKARNKSLAMRLPAKPHSVLGWCQLVAGARKKLISKKF